MPLAGIVFLVAAVIAIFEGFETFLIVSAGVSTLICIVISIACYKHKNYDVCYTAFCTIISCVMLPMAIITNGGIHSGMPLLCIVGTFLCSFCINKKIKNNYFHLVAFSKYICADCFNLFPQYGKRDIKQLF